MNRQEKINLIKQVQAGDLNALKRIKQEREKEINWQLNFFSCFHYLAANGRISGNLGNFDNSPITMLDLEPLVREIQEISKLSEDFDYGKLSDRVLYNIVEIFDSLKMLENRNELHLLEKYRNLTQINK